MLTTRAKSLDRHHLLEQHRHGRANGMWKTSPSQEDRRILGVVLSDRTIKRLLGEGRIDVDPYDEALAQPSSVDDRADRWHRVVRNSRYPYVDVKQEHDALTELAALDYEH